MVPSHVEVKGAKHNLILYYTEVATHSIHSNYTEKEGTDTVQYTHIVEKGKLFV